MINAEQQKVPLGGTRVPDSMGGGTCEWEALPVQEGELPQDVGLACEAVMSFRKEWGTLKKALSDLAPPVKDVIYALVAAKGNETGQSVQAGKEALAAAYLKLETCASLCKKYAAQSLVLVEQDEALVATSAKLVVSIKQSSELIDDAVTKSKALADSFIETAVKQTKTAQENVAKDVYGDFSLQLQVHTRKAFAEQAKLLEVIKTIKKFVNNFAATASLPVN